MGKMLGYPRVEEGYLEASVFLDISGVLHINIDETVCSIE